MMKKKNNYLLALLLIWSAVSNSYAAIRLPSIIADHMVLQQQSKITLWGWANPNEKVEISCNWQKNTITVLADQKGEWKIEAQTIKAGGPYTIMFKGASTSLTVKDVYLGEVWFCSGQSNMEWNVGREKFADSVIRAASNPLIRMFTVAKFASPLLKNNVSGNWDICSPQTVAKFSAVAYHFAVELSDKLKIPIGLIHSSWGGTPAESWVSKAVLESQDNFKPILKRFDESIGRYDAEKAAAGGKEIKNTDPRTRFNSPSVLYNAMFYPLINYKIKGVLWYQGEANANRAHQYRDLFPALIESWRNEFKNKDLPFYFVQIAPFKTQNPEIRDAQFLTTKTSHHVGMVVTMDVGDCEDIHPKDKITVGNRLANIALNNTYGFKEIDYLSPMYKSIKIDKGSIKVLFDTQSTLTAKGDLVGFTIAGEDQKFYPAKAKLNGKEVIVSSEQVKNPVAVRYAWENCANGNLFNKANLPASPFRSDSWKWITEGVN
jgi:sialate O-acetylesterase